MPKIRVRGKETTPPPTLALSFTHFQSAASGGTPSSVVLFPGLLLYPDHYFGCGGKKKKSLRFMGLSSCHWLNFQTG